MQRRAVLGGLLALLAIAMYARTFNHDIAIDDRDLLEATPSFSELFFERHSFEDTAYYRPVPDITYLSLHAFAPEGQRVRAAHVQNVLFYGVAALLLFEVCLMLLPRSGSAFIGAFAATGLFVVHPIHTESVAWISARPDILVLIWIAAAMLTYRRYQSTASGWWVAASALFALLSALTKEAGIAVLVILAAFELLYPARASSARVAATPPQPSRRRRRRALRSAEGDAPSAPSPTRLRRGAIVAFGAVAIAYIGLRLVVFDGRLGSSETDTGALATRDLFGAIGFYAQKLFAPTHLVGYYADIPSSATDVALGVLAVIVWSAALIMAIRFRQRAVTLGLVWIAATLAPSLPVFVASASIAPVAERYLFLPSAGLAICIAPLFAWAAARLAVLEPRKIAAIAVAAGASAIVALAALFAFQTNERVGDWSDLETFLEATIDDDPEAGIPHLYLAHVYARAGRVDDARAEFIHATESQLPEVSRATAWYEYALWLDSAGFEGESSPAFEKSLGIEPESVIVRRDFAASQWRRAMSETPPDRSLLDSALAEAERAVVLGPGRSDTLVLLGTITRDLGDYVRAREAFEQALLVEQSRALRQRIRAQLDSLPR